MTSARFLAIGCTETERLLTAHLLSRHGTCSALPATTSSSELAGRHRPREARSRRSMIGRQRPHATQSPLSLRPQSRQRHLRLRARELEMFAVRDMLNQVYLTRDTALLVSHRLRKESPRARPRARVLRRKSRTGDQRAKVPKIVLRLNIAILIGTTTDVVAGAAETVDGGDCSAVRHREVMGRTGSAQQSPSLPHAEDEHAMRAIFMVGYVGLLSPIVPSSTSIEP